MKVKLLSRVRLLATPWTAAYQAPPSVGFSSQEYWSGVPLSFPSGVWVEPQIGKLDSIRMVDLPREFNKVTGEQE